MKWRRAGIYLAQAVEWIPDASAARLSGMFDAIATGLEAELGDRLTMPARTLSLGFQALIRGFAAQWGQTPDEVTEDVIAANFEALLVGATASR